MNNPLTIEGLNKAFPFILVLASVLGSAYSIKTDIAVMKQEFTGYEKFNDYRVGEVERIIHKNQDNGLLTEVASVAAPLLTIK